MLPSLASANYGPMICTLLRDSFCRDNLPNPKAGKNPYVPSNSQAIGDLWDLFDFGS